jgi:hypothetical protein
MAQTVRKHLRDDQRRGRAAPVRARGSGNRSRSPSPVLPHSTEAADDADLPHHSDDDEFFDFDAADSGGSAHEPDDFQWAVSDSDELGSPRFTFSSDSEDDPDFDALLVRETDRSSCSSDAESSEDASSDGEFYVEEITTDPLFRTRASLFEEDNDGPPPDEPSTPWAFEDHPAIRNAYIRAFVGAAFEGMTHRAVKNMLDSSRIILQSAEASGVEFPGLSNFARTLPTVERRLGVSTDDLITYFFLCDVCWALHYPSELARLETPKCDRPNCVGTLYSVKRLSSGKEKKTPLLTLPFVPPGKAIQRLCLQPGKVAQWQEWRGDDDAVGQREPSKLTGFEAFDNPDKPMMDITDGWGWRAIQAGLQRR